MSRRKNSNSIMKRFGIGLCSGILGGAIAFGGLYAVTGMNNATSSTGIQSAQTATKVQNVKYNVESDVTKAVSKVQGAVVSIINLQNQSSQGMGGLEDFFGAQQGNSSNQNSGTFQTASEGSGVIYKKEGKYAYIVTNNHVVEGQNALQVLLATVETLSLAILITAKSV